ncbi:small integral membrane protein 8 [Hylaeus volcanicus]|uniref:small integral membrane protein 8 n=1 Tax=Hylaeus volcanicus TaxID=313075 RepID=UPI0023B80F33|nr:small integral membrane protein 8 [Hylaeus volcanicus]
MNKKDYEPAPGDGIRSLRSTTLFRAVNYELYIKPNKGIMLFGTIAICGCIGYIMFMRQNHDGAKYYSAVTADGTVVTKKKTSKWSE